MQSRDDAVELEPWILAAQLAGESSLQLWEIAELQQNALAIFSDEQKASEYARSVGLVDYQVLQAQQPMFLKILIECHEQEIKHVALNPSGSEVSRLFVIKDLLQAAKQQLRNQKP